MTIETLVFRFRNFGLTPLHYFLAKSWDLFYYVVEKQFELAFGICLKFLIPRDVK